MTTNVRSEDPAAAARRIDEIASGDPPPVGQRDDTLMDLAYRCAEAGMTNSRLLETLEAAALAWGKCPQTFERWTRLLAMLRRVRATYPNGPRGQGWRPDETPEVS